METLSWKPRLGPGDHYCAPACGRGCTYTEYQAALAKAEIICGELGEAWVPHVWENLGWHGCALFGDTKVHLNAGSKSPYVAYNGAYHARGETAPQAVVNLKALILSNVKGLMATLKGIPCV